MDSARKSELKEQYKDREFQAGVFQIRNLDSGRIFVGCSTDIQAVFNRHRAELNFGGCRIKQLQADWKELGEDRFAFEVLDVLNPSEGKREVDRDELSELENLWLEKLQPWDERGYNSKPRNG